jgi:DNA-binding NtrC family response regulator
MTFAVRGVQDPHLVQKHARLVTNSKRNTTMSTEPTILFVGHDSDDRESIIRTLDSEPYRVLASSHPDEAGQHLEQGAELVIIDLQSAAFDALDLLRRWHSSQPGTSFVFITEDRDVTSAVEAMKLGAIDCLVKPIDQEELRMLVAKLLDGQAESPQDQPRGGRKRQNIEIPPGTSLEDLQRAAVEQALAQHHGNRTHAAKTLGISVRTLQRKLKSWGMPLAATAQHQFASHQFLLTPHETQSPFSAHAH